VRCSSAVLALAGAVLLVPAGARAQESSGESSLEIGFWKRVNARDMLYFPISETRADETDHAQALAGVSYDRAIDSTLSVRGGYRYIWELTTPEGVRPYREQQVVAELFVRPWPGARFEMVDRSRLELRWIDGDPSWRFRNRVRLGRVIPRRRVVSIMPYGTVEGTYDSRYRSINRLRLSLGAVTRFTRWLGVDAYAARQQDTRADAAKLAAAGVTLNVYF
jgi:hypothetical protein